MNTSFNKDPVEAIHQFLAALPTRDGNAAGKERGNHSESSAIDNAGQLLCAMVDAGLDAINISVAGCRIVR